MSSVSVAAIMTVFNRRETTLRCLGQLRAQALPEGVRLQTFVVDDGSTDGTGDAIRSDFPEVRVLEGTGSLFWTGGMHLADQAAWDTRPDYLLWLNDDVDLDPDAVVVLLDAARQTDDRALVVGGVTDPKSGEVSYGGYRRIGRPLDLERVAPNGQAQSVDTMNGNVVLAPTAVRAVVGPPDLMFSHNMADMDYALRARSEGFDVVLAPRAVGRCETNTAKQRWRDPSVPFRQRWELVRSVKGMPPREWWTFTRRHTGAWWPRYFVAPYVRTLLPSLTLRRRSASGSTSEDAETNRLAVLHLFGPLRRSGAEVMWRSGLPLLDERGIDISILALADEDQSSIAADFTSCGVRVRHTGASRWQVLIGLVRALLVDRPDCVHVHAERMSVFTTLVPRVLGIPVVRTVHSVFRFDGALSERKRFERRLSARLGVRFVSISTSVSEVEQDHYGITPGLIENWVDDSRFKAPSEAERKAARARLGIEDSIPVVALVGNCSEVKNHDLAFEALALIPADTRPTLLHVGDELGGAHERDLMAKLGLGEFVRFLGSLADVSTVLRASDAFVMPSTHEGFGISALEALGTGLPIAITDVPGLRDLATHGPSVVLSKERPSSLAAAIVQALNVEPTVNSESAQSVRGRFGLERGIAQYAALYREVQ